MVLPKTTDFIFIKKEDLYNIEETITHIPRNTNDFNFTNQIINIALLN